MKFRRSGNSIENEVEKFLSERFGRQVKIHSSDLMGGGCINNASRITTSEGEFFLKWNAGGPAALFLREAESLVELKKAAGNMLAIPEVFAVKEVGDSPGFIVLEYFEPGYSLNHSDELLGRGLAAIHKYTNDRFGFYNETYCGSTFQDNTWNNDWVAFYRDNRLDFLLDLIQQERTLPLEEERIFRQLMDKLHFLIPGGSEPVLIHGDLWSGNFMNTANGPALIDPAACYADREMEFGIITLFGGFSGRFFNAYNEVNPLPSEWKERNALYQLYHVLNHYYLFGGSYRSQALRLAKSYL